MKVFHMKKSHKNKYKSYLRKDLVHAAGCTHPDCLTVTAAKENVQLAIEAGVKIPRTLQDLK